MCSATFIESKQMVQSSWEQDQLCESWLILIQTPLSWWHCPEIWQLAWSHWHKVDVHNQHQKLTSIYSEYPRWVPATLKSTPRFLVIHVGGWARPMGHITHRYKKCIGKKWETWPGGRERASHPFNQISYKGWDTSQNSWISIYFGQILW